MGLKKKNRFYGLQVTILFVEACYSILIQKNSWFLKPYSFIRLALNIT